MAFRVIFAALIGGALAFGGGFIDHMMLKWVGRHIKKPADSTTLREAAAAQMAEPGVYFFPAMAKDFSEMTEEEQKQANEEFKKGPSGMVVRYPSGEDLMSMQTLGAELATNVMAAFIAAVIVSMTRPNVGFVGRWVAVVLLGVFSWVSVNASYHIWYRFPWPWVQDELFCALLEWGLAGIAIAAIVRPRESGTGY